MASIFFFSDQPVLARGLREILRGEEGLELLDHASNAERLLDAVASHPPDLLFLDLTTDFTLDFLASVHRTAPAAKIVLWVHFISTEMALQAMGLGVRGILSKTLPPDVLVAGMKKIHAGELWF